MQLKEFLMNTDKWESELIEVLSEKNGNKHF